MVSESIMENESVRGRRRRGGRRGVFIGWTAGGDVRQGAIVGFDPQLHECVASDTFDFIKDKKDVYDVIILDPPAFANIKMPATRR